jgi:starch phosphorylase
MVLANPRLSDLVTEAIGEDWIRDLSLLRRLEPLAEDSAFLDRYMAVKRQNKQLLAARLKSSVGELIDPDSVFDVQVKRIHEYKRQHLNILHVICLYQRLKYGLDSDMPPRTFIFGGKSAPGYHIAKLIIKLITSVGAMINHDPEARERLRVVFMPNFNVTGGQAVYPGADVSEQISTAGKEASGTGNMKFAMNGALTIGTMDGANIELREEIGAENFFEFGLTAEAIQGLRRRGYRPMDHCESDPELAGVIELIRGGFLSRGDTELFAPLVDGMLHYDPYFVLADFRAYAECQASLGAAYLDRRRWARMALLNTARSGKFSSDRTIREYCRDIWNVQPVHIELNENDHTTLS